MNTCPPDSPTKLPSYSAPSLNPIRPPSPLTGNLDDPLNSFVTPAGCELILRNPNKAADGSTIKIIKAALASISTNGVNSMNCSDKTVITG